MPATSTELTPVKGRSTAVSTGFDIILPCYNPPPGWVDQLVENYYNVRALLPDMPPQLIVVIDGPAKNVTPAALETLQDYIPGIKVVNYPMNRGKGHALRLGVAFASNPYQVCTDIDFPFGSAAIAESLDLLQHGADVVAGVRGPGYNRMLPQKRKIISGVNRMLNRHLLRLKVIDAQAGLKAFNSKGREAFLSTRVNGFLFDSEFVRRAGKNRLISISTVRIHCREDITFSEFRPKVLWNEMMNFFGILLTS